MTITKQVLNRLKCECVLVPFLVAHAHWYKGPVIMQSKRPVIMFSTDRCFGDTCTDRCIEDETKTCIDKCAGEETCVYD